MVKEPAKRRPHYAGYQHVPPVPGSRGYIRVVNRGCGGHTDYWGEFDCRHGYTWSCEDCPIVAEQQPDYHEPQGMFQLT